MKNIGKLIDDVVTGKKSQLETETRLRSMCGKRDPDAPLLLAGILGCGVWRAWGYDCIEDFMKEAAPPFEVKRDAEMIVMQTAVSDVSQSKQMGPEALELALQLLYDRPHTLKKEEYLDRMSAIKTAITSHRAMHNSQNNG